MSELTRSDRWLIGCAVLILSFVFLLAAGAAGCNQYPPDGYEAGTQQTQHYCSANGLFFLSARFFDFVDRNKELINALGTATLALFTVILALATVRLWQVTAGHGRHMEESARAALLGAQAARDSADALPALERAYLFLDIKPHFNELAKSRFNLIQRNGVGDATTSLHIDFQLINHGKTPAIIKSINAELHHLLDLPEVIRYADQPSMQDIVVSAGGIYPTPITSGPNDFTRRLTHGSDEPIISYHQMGIDLSEPLSAEDAASIQAGNSFLWFYGRVIYEDVFGKSPRETRYCWRYDGPRDALEQYDRGTEGLNRRT